MNFARFALGVMSALRLLALSYLAAASVFTMTGVLQA